MVASCKLIPSIIRQTVVILIFHHIDNSRLSRKSMVCSWHGIRISENGKIDTIRIIWMIFNRILKFKYHITSERTECQTSCQSVHYRISRYYRRASRRCIDELTRCRDIFQHIDNILSSQQKRCE